MTHSQLARDFRPTCRTVVVAVKLDSESKELLTWALVKVAQPGDCVIALHVLSTNEVVDQDGKSSLLSLFKTFDSVLAVYEGFCNLKQVDLKLKICRGSSIRKILVREAKSYFASEIILGTARNHHTIRSSTSTAKYCAKKLHEDCSIIAVNNGKIVFCRESSTGSNLWANGTEDYHRNGLFGAIQRKLSKNSNILKDSNGSPKPNKMIFQKLGLANYGSELKKNCSICSPESVCADDTSTNDVDVDNSLALVPVEQPKSSNPLSNLIKEMTESRPGWPLLRQSILSNRKASVRKISVVEWAMRLPDRRILQITSSDCLDNQSCKLDSESGAIVLVGSETESTGSYKSVSLPKELEGLHEKYASTCRLFKYQELVSATSNFKPENMIGKGGSSQVYRGCLPDNKEVAVKILNSSEDVLKEFVLEIEIISTLNHKNIISLFGFCFEDNNLLLVYDFLSRGSLEENLQGNKKKLFAFGWSERFKVAFGVAEALQYLHNISEQPVIHRDVKSSNILLSDDFEPQLSDFGLATWASTTSSHITCTDVLGTFGYLAPEYFMYGKVNDKIDVYAFGVVLLELLSGRKPISNEYPKGQESLVMWAKPILNGGKITQLLDPSLGNDYDNDQMESMILAATLSIRRSPRARPSMNLVLKILQGDLETIKWARLEINPLNGVHGTIKVNPCDGCDPLDDEDLSPSNLQSHLNIVFKDMNDSSLSMSSIDQSVSLEDYLQGRWSRSSSFD